MEEQVSFVGDIYGGYVLFALFARTWRAKRRVRQMEVRSQDLHVGVDYVPLPFRSGCDLFVSSTSPVGRCP